MRLLVRTNKPGYMTIYNVGPTGNTNLLFNEYVEAFSFLQIPKNTNMRFVGPPGTEKIFIMLSNQPNPVFNQAQSAANPPPPGAGPSAAVQPPPPSTGSDAGALPPLPPPPASDSGALPPLPQPGTEAGSLPPLPPPSADSAALPPPPPVPSMIAGVEGAKSLRGSKDIVAEDTMKTNYAVISPRNNYRPKNLGTKDIVLESSVGNNFGVVPASALSDGGILTVEIKLEHR